MGYCCAMSQIAPRSDHPLSMRLPPGDIALIDRAASLRGRSRTEFIRDAAVREAEAAILESGLIRMSAAGFTDFVAAIEAPAMPVAELVALFKRVPPWGRKDAAR